MSDDGADLLWADGPVSHAVKPLIRLVNGVPDWPDSLNHINANPDSVAPGINPEEIRGFIADLRCRDPLLDDPDVPDFLAKAKRLSQGHSFAEPWWAIEKTLGRKNTIRVSSGRDYTALLSKSERATLPRGAPHVMVDPAVLRHSFPGYDPRIDLSVDQSGDLHPGEMIAKALGLAMPVSVSRLCEWVDAANAPALITIDASRATSRGFLRILEWVADLSDPNLEGTMRTNPQVVVARSREQLADDEERFWDRIPPQIADIFRLRPLAIHYRLPSFYWPEKQSVFIP